MLDARPAVKAAALAAVPLTLCAVLYAAPARSDATEAVVAKLRFEGVEAFETRAVAERMQTAAPSWKPWVPDPGFDEQTLREDLDRVVGFYREWGYYEAQAEYELDWNRRRSKVRILIRVHEGQPVRVAERSILLPEGPWLGAPQRDALLADLPLAEGAIFGAAPYREAKDELLRRLANLARPAASLEGGAEVDLGQRSARVRWAVDPGPEVHFGPVSVEGLVDVDAELVLRELAFQEGDLFSGAALDAGQRSIYELRLFRSVSVQGKRPGPEAPEGRRDWPVVVRVEERPPHAPELLRRGAHAGAHCEVLLARRRARVPTDPAALPGSAGAPGDGGVPPARDRAQLHRQPGGRRPDAAAAPARALDGPGGLPPGVCRRYGPRRRRPRG
jgi:hypothetical protein